ncbi:MAG: hypothetical protein HYZ84_01275 [Candidatus Omnitrophica bacterium]|nr:hypothetical protein [Candidatus Omnitrophota bacterium]
MIGFFSQLFILALAVIFLAWGAGLRINSQNLQTYLSKNSAAHFLKQSERPDLRKITLTHGGSMIGELTDETEESVNLKIDGGIIGFSKSEIVSIDIPSREEIQEDSLAGELESQGAPQILSFDPQKNVFNLMKNSPGSTKSAQPNTPLDILGQVKLIQNAQKFMAEKMKRDIQNAEEQIS